MTNDQIAGAVFIGLMGAAMVGLASYILLMNLKDHWGEYPRGTRWLVRGIPALGRGVRGGLVRVFYGDVTREREAEKLKLERAHGMTPWWDDRNKMWRHGDVESVTNQHGFVVARRPRDYVNRVATPVRMDKEQSA
jgi:hypothetical protein